LPNVLHASRKAGNSGKQIEQKILEEFFCSGSIKNKSKKSDNSVFPTVFLQYASHLAMGANHWCKNPRAKEIVLKGRSENMRLQ